MLDDPGREEIKEIYKYWRKNCFGYKVEDVLPQELKDFFAKDPKAIYPVQYCGSSGAPVPNYEKVFKVGLKRVIFEAEQKLRELMQLENIRSLNAQGLVDYEDQVHFLRAVILTCRAAIRFSERYATLARDMAAEKVGDRKRELLEIADICTHVPANPCRTFHDALQCFFLIHLVTHHIEYQQQGINVRFDKLMGPFYEKDLKSGLLSREKALELIELLWIKFEECGILRSPQYYTIGQGTTLFRGLNIGGLTEGGKYVCNEISYLCLEATDKLRTIEPSLTLRYHPKMPKKLLDRSIDLIATGHGMPAIFNDPVILPHLLNKGIRLKDATDYTLGCVTWFLPGKNLHGNNLRLVARALNLAGCFELALYQGRNKQTGQLEGAETADPASFKSIEELINAYLDQVRYFLEKLEVVDRFVNTLYGKYFQLPFTSALLDGCIERAKDCTQWAEYSYPRAIVCGNTNVIDSLAAVKKVVFDEKLVSMSNLLEALKCNWVGHEILRQKCLNAPKWGNGDEFVDEIGEEFHRRTEEVFERFTDIYGTPWTQGGSAAALYNVMSLRTGATPDGRYDGDLLADAVLSPAQGKDKKGPTAVLASTSRVDALNGFCHLLNQRFMPQFLTGKYKEVFADYIRTWSDLGHWHIQFNVVDSEILREAQKEPEKHSHLIVRVAGYSAFFVDLSEHTQNDIISRSTQCLV
jgi:formate C-acetyltransferase